VCPLAFFSNPFLYNRPKIQRKVPTFEVARSTQITIFLVEIPPIASNTGFVPVHSHYF